MALHTMTQEGDLGWKCPHCDSEQKVHVSHAEVQHVQIPQHETVKENAFTDPKTGNMFIHSELRPGTPLIATSVVALPACDCGTQTFLKVEFTDEELGAMNMIDEQGNYTESHAVAQRHMQLKKHMQAIGKSPGDPYGLLPPVDYPS